MTRLWCSNPSVLEPCENTKGGPDHSGAPDSYSREHHLWQRDTVYASNDDSRGRVRDTWVRGVHVYDGDMDEHCDIVVASSMHRSLMTDCNTLPERSRSQNETTQPIQPSSVTRLVICCEGTTRVVSINLKMELLVARSGRDFSRSGPA